MLFSWLSVRDALIIAIVLFIIGAIGIGSRR